MFSSVTWLAFLAGAIIWLINRVFSKRRPAPLPPGPRPLPLIGNMFDMPTTKPWLTFADWVKYGDISHIEILGKHIVVLNSVKEAQAMLDKKNSKYSDRPGFPMGGELAGCKYFLPLVGDGNRSRETRRQFHRSIGTHAAIRAYHDIEYLEVHKFLKRVYEHPERLAIHVRRVTGSIVLRISHGYQVQDDHDSFIELGENALLVFSKSTTQGAFLVDNLPFLQYIPEWFPGAGFKTMARKWKAEVLEMVNLPHQWVKEQMAAGVASKSFTSTLLDVPSLTEEDDHIIKWSAASFYGGGADTASNTASAINAFFLAMTLFPEAQKKAQAEIDAVIGTDRLPSYTDRESLPFVQAIVKEVLRWHVVSPIIFPHLASEDDVHGGYCIPKGSIVLANAWFMLHDPRVYSDPMEFRPERFLACGSKDPEPDPRTIAFGFGRRICPGLLLANESLWLSAVASLAVFNISKVVENGVEITPEVDPSPHTIRHVSGAACSIKPRSAKALELIQQDTY
ncbi:cytochrome P450 [Scleroderma yunnanense]